MAVTRAAGASTFPNLNTNGTGPYRLVERQIDVRTVIEPNPTYWGGPPTNNITRATLRPVANAATRVAALLSGEFDIAYPIPFQDIQRVSQAPNTRIVQGPSGRTIYLGFDVFRDESLDMPGTGRNPLKDVRVRQAIYHAIDENAIVRVVMRGSTQPAGLFIAPSIGGYQQDMSDRLPFNPDRARELLREAGYPNGFPLTLHCPNNRYVNDEAICTAVVTMLSRIGIRASLRAIPFSQYVRLVSPPYETDFFYVGWSPATYDTHNSLLNLLVTRAPGSPRGIFNVQGYSNPRVDQLTDLIQVETDTERRNAMIREALTIARDDVAQVPIVQQVIVWAAKDNIDLVQSADNLFPLRYVRVR
jgi:peptide/nickel transport system substrate-binding protein